MNSLTVIFINFSLLTKPSAAYIDPATTSYLIQIIVGVIIAIGTFIGVYRNKIKNFFKKKSNNPDEIQNIKKKEDNQREVVTAADLLDDDN